MKRISILFSAALMMVALSFASCEKEEEVSPLLDLLAIDDEVSSYFDETLLEVDEITFTDGGTQAIQLSFSQNSGSRSKVTTSSGDTVIHTITFVNFVNGNSQYERVKNGTIVVKVLGRPGGESFWREITFVDFSVNGNFIECVQVVEKTGQYQFTITLTDGVITFTDGTTYTREFERVRTWTAGFNTPMNIWDDEFEIEGQAWGVNRRGLAYTHTITEPLLVRLNCRWIVKGVIVMVIDNQTGTLNYGNGDCDQFATITINGETQTIRLRGGKN